MVFRASDGPATDANSESDASNEIFEAIADGTGEAVYVGGIVDEGFVSALATNDDDREFAAAIADAADHAIGVFVSGPSAKQLTIGRSSRVKKHMADDVFDRFEHVGVPCTPRDIRDPETRCILAASKLTGGRSLMG